MARCKLLLIGWDAADWKVINPLLDAGLMPALQSIVDHGVIGNLATLQPPLSPMLWTSIATGMRAYRHGVLGFAEPDPQQRGIRPVSVHSRKVKAVWNILMQSGLRTHVVGWWPSHPAEPLNGVCISNLFHRATNARNGRWPVPPGAVHPERVLPDLAPLRIHPGELSEAHLLPFVPRAAEIDQDHDRRLAALARTIAECSTVHAAATHVMEHEPWDFMAIYYDAIDHFSHAFMHFHPPRAAHVPGELFELYKDVVTGAYRFHDMMLGRLLALAGPDTTVMLVSDHGFHSDHLRPRGIPKVPAGPAVQHRPLGVFALRGPGIREDARVYGAGLLDIAPTILHLFGLPAGRDMEGRVLVQALAHSSAPEFIPSWEDRPGDCGMHPAEARRDPLAEQALMDQMIALGYIEPLDADTQKNVERAVRESRYNLARVYLDAGRNADALPLLERLHADEPEALRFAFQLAKCYYALRRLNDCRRLVEQIAALRAAATAEPGEQSRDEPHTAHRERVTAAQVALLEGSLLLAEKRYDDALERFRMVEGTQPRLPSLHLQLGRVYLGLMRWADAEHAYTRALEIDPDSAEAHDGRAVVLLRMRDFAAAADAALTAVGISYHMPLAHFHLGVALVRMGQFERAREAFDIAVTQRPGLIRAHRWLRVVHRRLGNTERSLYHANLARALLRERRSSATDQPCNSN